MRRVVALVVALVLYFDTAKMTYITLQVALGQASHPYVGRPLHGALYSALGVGATAMRASQPLLAWQTLHPGRADTAPLWRRQIHSASWAR